MEKVRDSGILAIYCALIFYLSAQTHLPITRFFTLQDKVIHFGAYALLGLLAWRSFGHFVQKRSVLALCCVAFCGLYGLSDEVHQFFVPGL
ncbi:MAG: VanZ family protein, partial [Methylococcales bacterium]